MVGFGAKEDRIWGRFLLARDAKLHVELGGRTRELAPRLLQRVTLRLRVLREAVRVEQDDAGATVHFKSGGGAARDAVRADVVIDCEGVNSAIRRQFYPDDKIVFSGINTWRGVSRSMAAALTCASARSIPARW